MDGKTVKEPLQNGDEKSGQDAPVQNTDAVWDQLINVPHSGNMENNAESSPLPDHLTVSDDMMEDGESLGRVPDSEGGLDDVLIDTSGFKLDEILSEIRQIRKDFDEKIKTDIQKDKIIDELHKELQSHKNDFMKKYMEFMVMDVIQFTDSMRKLMQYYKDQEISSIDPLKLLGILQGIPSDLEDLCARQGVNAFVCDEDTFVPARQRVLKRIETAEAAKDKMIEERIHPGYEWDGRVIRPELVTVYACKTPAAQTEMRDSDD
ncbi:MAG: nucleotide exchange factor GrpE [Desulfococcaceae bacterium]